MQEAPAFGNQGKRKELISSSQEKYAIDHHITLLLPVHQSKKKSNATPSSGSTLGTNTLKKRKQGKSRTCTYDKHAFLYRLKSLTSLVFFFSSPS